MPALENVLLKMKIVPLASLSHIAPTRFGFSSGCGIDSMVEMRRIGTHNSSPSSVY